MVLSPAFQRLLSTGRRCAVLRRVVASIRLAGWLVAAGAATAFAQPPAGGTESGQGNSQELTLAAQQIREAFSQLDRDHDQRITRAEFLARDLPRPTLERDLRLYDFDRNGTLDASEFAAVAGLVPARLRGSVPDPFDRLVDQAIAALDESYEGWNRRPRELVNAHTFVANFLGSISLGNRRFVTGRILQQADRNSDGRMSRSEASKFLRLQLGLRWFDGPPLREPTGRVLRFDRFLAADADQSESLSRQEFQHLDWGEAKLEITFTAADRDGNGQVSYLEYADPRGVHYFDPLEWFRAADTNLDALLQRQELLAASEASRRWLIAPTYAAFDRDGDQALTLQEYRLSMHGNVNYFWNRKPTDLNGDGHLAYDEFVFDALDLFQLQRRYYFHRHDLNADNVLTSGEFPFHPSDVTE